MVNNVIITKFLKVTRIVNVMNTRKLKKTISFLEIKKSNFYFLCYFCFYFFSFALLTISNVILYKADLDLQRERKLRTFRKSGPYTKTHFWQTWGCWFQIWQYCFQIPAQKYPNKALIVSNLGISVFPWNLAIRQICGCWF